MMERRLTTGVTRQTALARSSPGPSPAAAGRRLRRARVLTARRPGAAEAFACWRPAGGDRRRVHRSAHRRRWWAHPATTARSRPTDGGEAQPATIAHGARAWTRRRSPPAGPPAGGKLSSARAPAGQHPERAGDAAQPAAGEGGDERGQRRLPRHARRQPTLHHRYPAPRAYRAKEIHESAAMPRSNPMSVIHGEVPSHRSR